MQRLIVGLVLLFLPACATTGVHQMKNGTLRVQCPNVQSECMHEADVYCADQGGVHVLSSRETNELYGVEGNKEGTLMSEIVFICADDAPRKPIKLPPRDEPAAPRSAPSVPNRRICVPGSTQRCVGPGACVGGQSCLPSGAGWSPCECASDPTVTAPLPEGSAIDDSQETAPAATSAPPPAAAEPDDDGGSGRHAPTRRSPDATEEPSAASPASP